MTNQNQPTERKNGNGPEPSNSWGKSLVKRTVEVAVSTAVTTVVGAIIAAIIHHL